ncbi:MAG: Carbohydrate kinase, FGGY-like protein [Conexibacter sp.]|nr:Carbohydrate kinase, FGGY-like protein [Conexibacter sp.]
MTSFAAIDFGASSGRVLTGALDDGRITLTEQARFANRPVRLPSGLHWNLMGLFEQALDALRGAGPLRGVGVDTWGVDYGLLDDRGRLLGLPFHYRDGRSDPMVQRAFGRVSRAEQYAATGIQTMSINTVFQLLADEGTAAFDAASRIAMVPDLLALWLSGELANERTNASTTGLLDARTGAWASGVIDGLGLPARLFTDLVEPGTVLGPVLPGHGLGAVPVFAVASHDTASAFAAAPVAGEGCAILSSGTWSLLGLELDAPVLTDGAHAANLTNERGVDGTTRLLKNVMGLWLEQECARAWGTADHATLFAAAAAAPAAGSPLFDPDDPAFLPPGDMPARIAAACAATGQAAPQGQGATVRAIVESLACKYRLVLELLAQASGREIRRIHVIGGGARVDLLCRRTADLTGCEVCAGPVEATAMGNLLVQARAAGELASLADIRAVAAVSADCVTYEPSADRAAADATYHRFLDVTGSVAPAAA